MRLRLNKALDPHVVNAVLVAVQVICLLAVFIAAYKAMHLHGDKQIAKVIVSYLAFVVFIVVDLVRRKMFPWIS